MKNPLQISGESNRWERFRLDCAALSAAGAGRPHNEDHCVFAAPGTPQAEQAGAGYLFAVIDGVAEGGRGRSAARETGTSLLEILDDDRRTELRPDMLLHRLHDANDRCHDVLDGKCAVSAVWIWEEPAASSWAVGWAHVGDTRLYHHGADGWRQMTRDHAKGRILDRVIGQGAGLLVDTGRRTLRPGERLVLLSDGVWKTAPPQRVLAREPFPATAEAVRQLVGQARLNGSLDDTSAIVITARTSDVGPEPEH